MMKKKCAPMDIALVTVILISVIILFATELFSIDLVAFLSLGALLALKLVTPTEAVSGLSHPATVTVATMFILSAGLQKTGAVQKLGYMIIRFGKHTSSLLSMLMATVGLTSAFINNTGVVAVFLPIAIGAAKKREIAPSKLLIPMSFASQAAGVCTLIGTSTNLIVSAISDTQGYGPFTMFEMAQFGIILFSVTFVYFLTIGYFLLPNRREEELTKAYQLGEYITELRVMKDSPLIGQSLQESKLQKEHQVKVIKILRKGRKVVKHQWNPLQIGDILLVEGKIDDLMELKDMQGLNIEPEFKLQDKTLKTEDLSLVEFLVPSNSYLIDRTLTELDFKRRYRVVVLAIQRMEKTIYEQLSSVRLRLGDKLLIQGPTEEVNKLRHNRNFIVLEDIDEVLLNKRKAPIALGVIALVVLSATFNILPIMPSALLGCLGMLILRCMTIEEAYDAIDWRVIFLLAGIIPLGIALEKTGAALWITEMTIGNFSLYGPLAVFAALYFITATLTESMSNNAAAILLAPIAISTAIQLGVNPKPFLMAVTFAASTSFATPIGYQTNAMVYSAGGYKYADFIKVGVPLNLIFWILSVIFIPFFWPFN